MDLGRIELPPLPCHGSVLPLDYRPVKLCMKLGVKRETPAEIRESIAFLGKWSKIKGRPR